MNAKLFHQWYGKERVRFLRVVRTPEAHRVMDAKAGITLEGEFDDAYYTDDNHQVVATDTMKNTLMVLAHDDPADALEAYALRVARHFLKKYAHVSKVTLRVEEKTWKHLQLDGAPHPFAFEGGTLRPTVRVEATRESILLQGGVAGLELMKTTQSGFAGFPRDEFTTLPDTDDRILATEAVLVWDYKNADGDPASYAPIREKILEAVTRVFAEEFSPSVQRTLLQMGEAALAVVPEIEKIRIAMPNKHYLPLNLSAFGRPEQQDRCYLPTNEPHGQIEAEIGRNDIPHA